MTINTLFTTLNTIVYVTYSNHHAQYYNNLPFEYTL